MANLCAGICSSLLVEKGAGYRGFARHRLRSTPCGGVAALPWNQWQLSPGMSGRLGLRTMAALAWNRWQLCRGIGGRIRLESVAALAWNTHPCAHDGTERRIVRPQDPAEQAAC